MSTVSATGSTLIQQLYEKLFQRLNTDGDEALTIEEMAGAGPDAALVSRAFKGLDADGDGRVTRPEMTPGDAFGHEVLAAMIQAQEGSEETADTDFLSALFARADLDGDGKLSEAERKAEADLRRAAVLDTGEFPKQVMIGIDADGDGLIAPEEAGVATLRRLEGRLLPMSPEDLPPSLAEQIKALRGDAETPPAPPADAPLADPAESLARLRTLEAARLAEAPLSDALAARLFDMMTRAWAADPTPTAGLDVKA